MSVYGRIIDGTDVELAAESCLKFWIHRYLAEVERQHDVTVGDYARPRSWKTANEMDRWPDDQLPAIIIISTGLTGDRPTAEGDGSVRAPWGLGVAAVVSANTFGNTRTLALRYAAAIRACLSQNQSLRRALDGSVRGVTWLDERYNELPPEDGRTIMAARLLFEVEVADVINVNTRPPEAEPEPEDWPTVEAVTNTQEVSGG